MNNENIARVRTNVQAPIDKVWRALVDPLAIERYMFGAKVTSDWKEGSPITWKGEFQGRPFEDKGTVLSVDEPHALRYSHRSGGNAEQEHTVNIELKELGGSTQLVLTQDNNASTKEQQESEKNWNIMLDGMKKMLEDAK